MLAFRGDKENSMDNIDVYGPCSRPTQAGGEKPSRTANCCFFFLSFHPNNQPKADLNSNSSFGFIYNYPYKNTFED